MNITLFTVTDYSMPVNRYHHRLMAAKEAKLGRYPDRREEGKIHRSAEAAICHAIGRYLREALTDALEGDSLMQTARLTVDDLSVNVRHNCFFFPVEIGIPEDTILTESGLNALRSHIWATLHDITTYVQTCQPFCEWLAALPDNLPCA